jgi:hypothetical protein
MRLTPLLLVAFLVTATAHADDGSIILRDGHNVRIQLAGSLPKPSLSRRRDQTIYRYSLSSLFANHNCHLAITVPAGSPAPVISASFVEARVSLEEPVRRGPRVAFWHYQLAFAAGPQNGRALLECSFRGDPERPGNETRISDLRAHLGKYFAFGPTAEERASTESGPRDAKAVPPVNTPVSPAPPRAAGDEPAR